MNQQMFPPKVRVCYFGTYRSQYSRNRILIEGLRRNGVEVLECHEPLWRGIEDRVQAINGHWKRPTFWWRVLRAYVRLLQRYCTLREHYDILIVGYPGQFDVLLARLLSWWHRKPLVWDVFMSIYLISVERGLHHRNPGIVRFVRLIERLACLLPDMLILDTEDYVQWFVVNYHISASRFRLVPTGANSDQFQPLTTVSTTNSRARGEFRVLYYGTFIPNHGVTTIIEAARLLRDEQEIKFELIGDGPEQTRAKELARTYGLTNLNFIEWLEPEALRRRIMNADLCLGVFGLTPQSLMTIQNKLYEGMAMGKPIVSGDSIAVRRICQHGVHIYLCERNDPQALAKAIRTLWKDAELRTKLGDNARRLFLQHYTIEKLGLLFKGHLKACMQRVR